MTAYATKPVPGLVLILVTSLIGLLRLEILAVFKSITILPVRNHTEHLYVASQPICITKLAHTLSLDAQADAECVAKEVFSLESMLHR